MRTMYIGANNRVERGYFLGDVLTLCKTAWLFIQNEPVDHVVLSLHANDPLNWIWTRFIKENCVTVVHDDWQKSDQASQYRVLDQRREDRAVKSIPFQVYKELYPRLDGGYRQGVLCGKENGIGRRNIFEYMYYGQETCDESPKGTCVFGADVIDVPSVDRRTDRSVFLAPHEKCQYNKVFTLSFWEQVVKSLLDRNISVVLNDKGGFCKHIDSPLLTWRFEPLRSLAECVASQRLVLCGNTGIGWLAGATGTPLIACERDMLFAEYSFAASGVQSLVTVIHVPNPDVCVDAVVKFLDKGE